MTAKKTKAAKGNKAKKRSKQEQETAMQTIAEAILETPRKRSKPSKRKVKQTEPETPKLDIDWVTAHEHEDNEMHETWDWTDKLMQYKVNRIRRKHVDRYAHDLRESEWCFGAWFRTTSNSGWWWVASTMPGYPRYFHTLQEACQAVINYHAKQHKMETVIDNSETLIGEARRAGLADVPGPLRKQQQRNSAGSKNSGKNVRSVDASTHYNVESSTNHVSPTEDQTMKLTRSVAVALLKKLNAGSTITDKTDLKAIEARIKKLPKLNEESLVIDDDDDLQTTLDDVIQSLADGKPVRVVDGEDKAPQADSKPQKASASSDKGSSKKKPPVGRRAPEILGHPASRVLNWAGKEGYSFSDAVAALKTLKVEIKDTTVRTYLTDGKNPKYCRLPELTKPQLVELRNAFGSNGKGKASASSDKGSSKSSDKGSDKKKKTGAKK